MVLSSSLFFFFGLRYQMLKVRDGKVKVVGLFPPFGLGSFLLVDGGAAGSSYSSGVLCHLPLRLPSNGGIC